MLNSAGPVADAEAVCPAEVLELPEFSEGEPPQALIVNTITATSDALKIL